MRRHRHQFRKSLPVLGYPHETSRIPLKGWLPDIRNVQVQTHSRCNADCLFCPYIESEHAAFPGKMSDEVWTLILDNLMPFADGINRGKFCPYLMQEPLIDPSIFSKILDIYDRFPGTCVEVSTNGAALSEKNIDKLLASMGGNRHEIWVSHHGINKETMQHVMRIDYDKATAGLLRLVEKADGRFTIKIRGAGKSSTTNQVLFTKEQYFSHLDALGILDRPGVHVDYFSYHDRAGTLKREDRGANTLSAGIIRKIDPQNPFWCCRVGEWVHFMWDGKLRLCCMDYHAEVDLPNITDMSLLEYFHSPEYKELTDSVSGKVGCSPGHICTRCVSPGG